MKNCEQCGLYQYSPCPKIMGKGNTINPKIILIGEAPGPDEAKVGIPFIGRAGKKLDQMIKPYKENIYITNMVKCYPPLSYKDPTKGFRVPKDIEIEYCKPFLIEEILKFSKIFNPVLMTLGNVALKGLIGENKGITKELGISRKVTINTHTDSFELIPNYHPSYILRNPSKGKDFIEILKTVIEMSSKG